MTDSASTPASLAAPSVSAISRVPADKTFELKKPCPYCGGKITVRATAWEEEPDGWVATSLDIDCDKEPDIDGPEWPEWSSAHGDGDYCEAWHQLHEAAIAALKRRVRFEMHSPNEKSSDASDAFAATNG